MCGKMLCTHQKPKAAGEHQRGNQVTHRKRAKEHVENAL